MLQRGGGIIEKEENCNWLKKHRNVFFLDTSWEEINRRLVDDELRPIWNNQNRDKKQLLARRLPVYREVANFIIKTDGKAIEAIAEEIVSKLDA